MDRSLVSPLCDAVLLPPARACEHEAAMTQSQVPQKDTHRKPSSCHVLLGPLAWEQMEAGPTGDDLPESTMPHAAPAAGGPGRWSYSRKLPSPQRSRGCTETLWCSVHGTSHFWKEEQEAWLKWEPLGNADPTTALQSPLHLVWCPPRLGQTLVPPEPRPAHGLTEAPGLSGSPSSSSPSCAPRWPAGAKDTVSQHCPHRRWKAGCLGRSIPA